MRRVAPLASVGLVVVVAAGLVAGLVWLVRADTPEPEHRAVPPGRGLPPEPGATVPLPSSGWEPGDVALAALTTGVIRVRADGCVVSGPPEPRPVIRGGALLWPAGWSARRDAGGRVEILDPGGGVVLREGDGFEVGGGGGNSARDWACGRGTNHAFAMTDVPRRVPAPAPDPTAGPGTPVAVPSSGWTPDRPAMTDLFTGRVLATEGNCVFGRPAAPARAGERTALAWPDGWTAQRSASDGLVEILDEERRVKLREGDLMTLIGGLRPFPEASASTCRPGPAEAFLVHGGAGAAKRASGGPRS